MKPSLTPGVTLTFRYTVPENKTVPHVYPESPRFREMPEVFATAYMVGLLEWACIEAMQPHLDPGEQCRRACRPRPATVSPRHHATGSRSAGAARTYSSGCAPRRSREPFTSTRSPFASFGRFRSTYHSGPRCTHVR